MVCKIPLRGCLLIAVIFVLYINRVSASPTLYEFVTQTWESNPSIQAAKAAIDVAQSQKFAADLPLYNPEFDVELERSDINTVVLGIKQTLDWGDKRTPITNIAVSQIKIKKAELDLQRLLLAERLLHILVNLNGIHQVNNLAKQRVNLMQNFVDNTRKRQLAGDVGLQDIALARVALSEAKIQFGMSLAEIATYEADLQELSGNADTNFPDLSETLPQLSSMLKPDQYIKNNPNIVILKTELAAARFNIKLAKAQRKADPTFGIRAGMEDNNALLGVSFSMPLNFRNNYSAHVDVENNKAVEIENILLSERRRSLAKVKGAWKTYRLTYDTVKSWQEDGLSSLNEQFELVQTLWKSGEMNTSEYLVQAKQNVDAQEAAVELNKQQWLAWINWLVVTSQIEKWIQQTNR